MSCAVWVCTATTVNWAQFVAFTRQAFTGITSPALNGPAAICCVTIPSLPLRLSVVGTLTLLAEGVQVTIAPDAGIPLFRTSPCGFHCAVAPTARKRFGVMALMAGGVPPVNSVAIFDPLVSEAVTRASEFEVALTRIVAVPSPAVVKLHVVCPQPRAALPPVTA